MQDDRWQQGNSVQGRLRQMHFDSTTAYKAWLESIQQDVPLRDDLCFGDVATARRGLQLLDSPDDTNIDQARALLAQFGESIEVEQQVWSHSVVGYFPDVPAYLAGDPEHMMVREFIRSDQTPLRVWVGVTSSAGIGESQLVKRGVTLTAFAMAMIARRPVIISPYVNLGNYNNNAGAIISWDISTEPLVLAELITSIARPEVTRHIGIYACYALQPKCTGAWDPDYADEERCRDRLGAKPEDLWLGSIHFSDPLLRDPVGWIKEHVARYSSED